MNIWKIISAILCMLLIALYLVLDNNKTKYSTLHKSIFEQSRGLDTLSFYSFNFQLNNALAGKQINNIDCDAGYGQMDLKTMLEGRPRFIYRYTEMNCNACIELVMEDLNELFGDSPNKVLLLSSHVSDRNFSIFKQVNQIQFPACKIDFYALDWFPESLDNPYCFILYPNMRVSDVFIPDKNFPDLSRSYFNRIKQLLSD